MPTPAETALAIRSEANTDKLAINSVIVQAETHLAEVNAWDSSAAKGEVRDELERLIGQLRNMSARMTQTSRVAQAALAGFGGGGPDVPPTPITWSTGAW